MSGRLLLLMPPLCSGPDEVEAAAESAAGRLRSAGFEPLGFLDFARAFVRDPGGVPDEVVPAYAAWVRAEVDGLVLLKGAGANELVRGLRAELGGAVPCRTVPGWLTWARQAHYMARLRHPAGKGAGL